MSTISNVSESVTKSHPEKNWNIFAPWFVFSAGILFFCFAHLLRVYPNVMETNLLSRFQINATYFTFIAGFYYFSYILLQLPIGLTVDRIGTKRSLLLGCTVAGAGVLLFALKRTVDAALLGRFLIGMGAAFGFITALKIASLSLSRTLFATATGSLTSIGMISAIATDHYLIHLARSFSLRTELFFPALIAMTLFIFIFLFFNNKNRVNADGELISNDVTYFKLLHQLWNVIRMPQLWLVSLIGALLYLPTSIFIYEWAIPFLRSARYFSHHAAMIAASLTLIGFIVSCVVTGYLSDRFKTRKTPLLIATVGSAIVSAAIIFAPIDNYIVLCALLFTLGLFCGAQPLCFAINKESCPNSMTATAIAFTSFVIIIITLTLKPLVGLFLIYLHGAANSEVLMRFSSWDFSIALSIVPIGLIIAYFSTLFIQETFGKQKITD